MICATALHEIPRDMPPSIRMVVGRPQDWIDASIASLRRDPDLYRRDTELVHITRVSPEEVEESRWIGADGEVRHALVAGTPTIHPMTLPTLRVRMATHAAWTKPVKQKGGGFEDIACEPTKAQAEELRDGASFPGIRALDGVSEAPFPAPDLSIVQEPGYDKRTRYLYEPSIRFPRVADAPSRADAVAAREALEDLFSDFHFVHPAGLSGVIAALLTLLCRPAILGPVPAWVIAATTRGTGKSTLADTIAMVALGRDAGRAHFPSADGRGADDEVGKRLGMFARMAVPLICWDNVDKGVIGGDVLEEVISVPGKYTFRLLGVTAGLTLPVRMLQMFTGNNPVWSLGMNRRILVIGLESPLENPELRPLDTYRHPERANCLPEYALAHRAEYVHHALTIVRAYAAAGCPSPLRLGTFEGWARLVASAIVWAGGENPMACRPSESGEESPDTLQRQALARQWDHFLRASSLQDGASAHAIVERLYDERGKATPGDGWDELRGAIEHFVPAKPGHAPDPAQLADYMRRSLRGAPIRVADAPAPLRRFVAAAKKSGGRTRWLLENVAGYVGRIPGAAPAVKREPAPPPNEEEAPVPVASSVCSVCRRVFGDRDLGACERCPVCGGCNSYVGSYQGAAHEQSEACRC